MGMNLIVKAGERETRGPNTSTFLCTRRVQGFEDKTGHIGHLENWYAKPELRQEPSESGQRSKQSQD